MTVYQNTLCILLNPFARCIAPQGDFSAYNTCLGLAFLHCLGVGKAQKSAGKSKHAEWMQIFWSSIYTFWNQTPWPLLKARFLVFWSQHFCSAPQINFASIRCPALLSPENYWNLILSSFKKKWCICAFHRMLGQMENLKYPIKFKYWFSVHASHLPLWQQWEGGREREAQKPFLGKQTSPAQRVPHVTAGVYSTHFTPPPSNSFHKWFYLFYKFWPLLIKIHS